MISKKKRIIEELTDILRNNSIDDFVMNSSVRTLDILRSKDFVKLYNLIGNQSELQPVSYDLSYDLGYVYFNHDGWQISGVYNI